MWDSINYSSPTRATVQADCQRQVYVDRLFVALHKREEKAKKRNAVRMARLHPQTRAIQERRIMLYQRGAQGRVHIAVLGMPMPNSRTRARARALRRAVNEEAALRHTRKVSRAESVLYLNFLTSAGQLNRLR